MDNDRVIVPVWQCLEREQLLFDADPRLLGVIVFVCGLPVMTGLYFGVWWLAVVGVLTAPPAVVGLQRAAAWDSRARRIYLRAVVKPLYLPRVGKRRTAR
jgi:type IV secretory pathway TrbD component